MSVHGLASSRPARSTRPATEIGPVPGSSENSNDRSTKASSTRAVVRIFAAAGAPSSVISS